MHTNPRCVLVDDDQDVLTMVGRFVEMICPEFEVIEFLSGIDALDYLMLNRAELIITDFRMPGINGLQLVNAVRKLDQEVPIIMLSGDNVADQALACGANAFVQKISMARQLGAVIQQLGIHQNV